MGKAQHVTKHPEGGWQVRAAGSSRATKRTKTQAEASSIARSIAINQRAEVVVHGRDGRIRAKDSYGHDPFPPRG